MPDECEWLQRYVEFEVCIDECNKEHGNDPEELDLCLKTCSDKLFSV